MLEILFIPFAILFVALQFSDRRTVRIIFSVVTIVAMAAAGRMFGLARNYGGGYTASAIEALARKAPLDQRDYLLAASKEYRREARAESPFSIGAASRLYHTVLQAESLESKKEGENGAGQPATHSESDPKRSDIPQPESDGRSR